MTRSKHPNPDANHPIPARLSPHQLPSRLRQAHAWHRLASREASPPCGLLCDSDVESEEVKVLRLTCQLGGNGHLITANKSWCRRVIGGNGRYAARMTLVRCVLRPFWQHARNILELHAAVGGTRNNFDRGRATNGAIGIVVKNIRKQRMSLEMVSEVNFTYTAPILFLYKNPKARPRFPHRRSKESDKAAGISAWPT